MATAIEVEHLTKTFVAKVAVDDISFSIDQGEIVGFLGPNGAGKTTTIRMLTCFLPATQGRASVLGYDVFDQSTEVRRRIGYLPESTPLYPEMRVEEYLRYRARLKGVARGDATRKAVDRAAERTQIVAVLDRIIGQLSKGYRQRVGLADALIASPPILILDEPTIGLDPNQIRQTRDLIRELGKDHTIFLSTHILPEVEQVCDRVVIINRGRIVGQGSPSELREKVAQGVRLHVVAHGGRPEDVEADLAAVEGVTKVTRLDAGRPGSDGAGAGPSRAKSSPDDGSVELSVLASADPSVRDRIFYAAVEGEWVLRELATESMSLEEVFAHVTSEEADGDEDEEGADDSGPDEDEAEADGVSEDHEDDEDDREPADGDGEPSDDDGEERGR